MSKQINLYSGFWAVSLLSVFAGLITFRCYSAIHVPCLINIQFSPSADIFKELLGNKYEQSILIANTNFDFLFILLYTILFFLSLKVFELSLQVHFKWYYYLLCFIPGIVDLIENYLLIEMVENGLTIKKFKTYFWSVRIKWTSVISFAFMALTISLYYGLVLSGRGYNFFLGIFKK